MSNLQEILEELSLHCYAETGKQSTIQVVLPRAVIERFSLAFLPKEKLVMAPSYGQLKKLYVNGGTVELLAAEETAVD